MSNMKIEFDGLKELQAEFEKKFGAISHKPVLEKGAEYFKEKLEDSVYDYGLKKRTGRSENSMAIAKSSVDNEIIVGVSSKNTDAFYLYYSEYGTSKIRARPFMRPTFENQTQTIIEKMADEMRTRLRL